MGLINYPPKTPAKDVASQVLPEIAKDVTASINLLFATELKEKHQIESTEALVSESDVLSILQESYSKNK
jgi:hypothetical protein